MKLTDLCAYLDDYLSVADTPDYPNALNGLQVEGKESVARIMTAVDGSAASIKAAENSGADILLVHHGIFWSGLSAVTGPVKARLRPLLLNDISLYSSHLPLDAHPEVGNNVLLAELSGLEVTGRFGTFQGIKIGVLSETDTSLGELTQRLGAAFPGGVNLLAAGPERVRRTALVSGGGAGSLAEAAGLGIDTFITGELQHHHYLEAEELGLNVIFAGHYATETLGIRALGEHLAEKFTLVHDFFDHPTGL